MNAPRILVLALSSLLLVGPATAQITATPAQRAAASALRDACKADYDRLCSGVRPGGGRILQCLDAHAADLSASCRAALPQAHALRAAVPDPQGK